MTPPEKPSFEIWLKEWLDQLVPFKLPRIPFPRVVRNLEKAAARVVTAASSNIVAHLDASTKRIQGKSTADQALINKAIEALQFGETSKMDLGAAALSYVFREAISHQENRENILRLATAELEHKPPKEDAAKEIDDDWLNIFARLSQEKSTEDIQQIWAKILASEILNPGTCSARTLEFLSKTTSAEAKHIVRIFSFVLSRSWIPRHVSPYEKRLLTHEDMLFADEIGILTGGVSIVGNSNIGLGSTEDKSFLNALKYFSKVGIFRGPDPALKIDIQVFPLSAIGRELYSVSDTISPDYDFFQSFCMSLSSERGLDRISIAEVVSDDGEWAQFAKEQILFERKR